MRHLLFLLAFLPLSAFAQVDQPCTPQLVIAYDAAGNRIQRKEACDPAGNPGTYSSSGESFRLEAPDSLAFTVSPNPGTVFLLQRSGPADTPTQLEVYSPEGRLLRTEVFEGPAHKLNLSAQPDGLYLLRLRSGGLLWEKSLLKRE